MFQYLASGESKVGFLNCDVERNMLHRDVEDKVHAEWEAAPEIVSGLGIPGLVPGLAERELVGALVESDLQVVSGKGSEVGKDKETEGRRGRSKVKENSGEGISLWRNELIAGTSVSIPRRSVRKRPAVESDSSSSRRKQRKV